MLKNHSDTLTGKVNVKLIVIVYFFHKGIIFFALMFFEEIFFFYLHYNIVLQIPVRFCRARCLFLGVHFLKCVRCLDNVEVKIRVNGRHKVIIYPYFAVCGVFKQVHAAQECALAAAGRSDDNNFLALFDFAGDSFEHLQVAEIFENIFNAYHLP